MGWVCYIERAGRSPTDIRYVPDDYVPLPNETRIEWTGPLPVFSPTQIELDEEAARKAAEIQRAQDIANNLPSWAQVEAYLDGLASLAEAKVALKKIARVVYWLAKNSAA